MPKQSKGGNKRAAYEIFAEYPEETQQAVKNGLREFRENKTFTDLYKSVNILAHATLLGYITTPVANTVAYQYQLMMMLKQQIILHEDPTQGLNNKFFDPEFMAKLTPEIADRVLKETNMAAKILIINNIVREQETADAVVTEILPVQANDKFSIETKKLLAQIKKRSDEPPAPEKNEQHYRQEAFEDDE